MGRLTHIKPLGYISAQQRGKDSRSRLARLFNTSFGLSNPSPSRRHCAQIEVESELQSLKAQLDDMTEKYSRAIAEQETVDSAPLREERVRPIRLDRYSQPVLFTDEQLHYVCRPYIADKALQTSFRLRAM